MSTRAITATLLAAAIAVAAAPDGRADVRQLAPGVAAAKSGAKDYGKNAATGDYRTLYADRVRTSSLAGTTSDTAPRARERALPAGDRFRWGDAGIGAGAGFLLALTGAACALGIRRRARPVHS